jgi:hypothetical protein
MRASNALRFHGRRTFGRSARSVTLVETMIVVLALVSAGERE